MKLGSQNGFRLVREFEEAVRADEFKGAAHPDERDGIAARYELTKARLQRFLVECLLIPSNSPSENTAAVRAPIAKGSWVMQMRGKSRGRVGQVARVYDSGRAVVQFGADGPFDEFALSSLFPASQEQIDKAEGVQ